MPWTETTRPDYDRRSLRYASDCTDEEWALVKPFLAPKTKVGRPRRTEEVVLLFRPVCSLAKMDQSFI